MERAASDAQAHDFARTTGVQLRTSQCRGHASQTRPVDTRVIEQVRTGKITYKEGVKLPETQFKHRRLPIDSYRMASLPTQFSVGGYPDYKGTPYVDSDKDGMPDAWETKNGLNPKDPSDASLAKKKDGYTNIEEYLNSVVPVQQVILGRSSSPLNRPVGPPLKGTLSTHEPSPL